MENKYLKDFVIAVAVIVLIAFAVKDYYIYQDVQKIPVESKYKKLALGEDLLAKIQKIEESIKDRKSFRFNVTKDPLEQNLIVKTMKDLEKQWRIEVEKMIRLESTIIPEHGEKLASIAHKGESNLYKIGDSFIGRKITAIESGKVVYSYRGTTDKLVVAELPKKPEAIDNSRNKKNSLPNW